jgi:hypothetical protein
MTQLTAPSAPAAERGISQPVQANPTFGKNVQIRTSGGKRHGLHTASRQHRPKRCAEFRVTIVQNITASIQISPVLVGRAAGDLFHPLLIRMSRDCHHTDPSAFPNEGRATHSRSPNLASSVLPLVKKSAPARTSSCAVIKSFHEVLWLRLGRSNAVAAQNVSHRLIGQRLV